MNGLYRRSFLTLRRITILKKCIYLLSMGPLGELENLRFEHDIIQFLVRKRVGL